MGKRAISFPLGNPSLTCQHFDSELFIYLFIFLFIFHCVFFFVCDFVFMLGMFLFVSSCGWQILGVFWACSGGQFSFSRCLVFEKIYKKKISENLVPEKRR